MTARHAGRQLLDWLQRWLDRRGKRVLTRFDGYRAATHDPIVRLCRQAVSAADLHYVAYYVRRSCVFHLDVLEDPALGRFVEVLTADDRRAQYARHGSVLPELLAGLGPNLREMDSGGLIRVVLDVERGALYHFVVDQETDRYLVGVTLDQDMVYVTDAKLSALTDEIRYHLGRPRRTATIRS